MTDPTPGRVQPWDDVLDDADLGADAGLPAPGRVLPPGFGCGHNYNTPTEPCQPCVEGRVLPDSECLSCGEGMPSMECPKAQRPCGHHCNCSWVHDYCHWCGVEFGEDGAETAPARTPS